MTLANTSSTTESKPTLFQRIIDSFKPAPQAGYVSMEIQELNHDDNQSNIVEKNDTGLHRVLKNRHLQMIAIGGSIGTGFFVGSGLALAIGGPGTLIICYSIIGFMLFNVCMALGELCVAFPVSGSFTVYSSRFLDPAWGFAMGWNFAMGSLTIIPLELTVAGLVISYWTTSINIAVWISIFLVALIIINLFGVRGFAEIEFFISLIKVIAIIGFIILGIVLIFGGGPNHQYLGGKYWRDPGAFVNGFKGVCSVLLIAALSFSGTEMVGLTAAETADPRSSIPRATKQVFWRVTMFYLVGLTIISCLVPYTSPRLLNHASTFGTIASPFVIAIEDAGIKVLPDIFNAVILLAILSVANSSVYAASRTLCALAEYGQAPKILAYIDRKGRPLSAIVLSVLTGFIAYINCAPIGAELFHWLLSIFGLSVLFNWASICACHIMFRAAWKAQGHTLDELSFVAPLGVIGSYFGLILNILCLVAQFYTSISPITGPPSAKAFFQAYLAVPIIIAFYVVRKIWKKTPFMRPSTVDLDTGRRLFVAQQLAEEQIERKQWPLWKRILFRLC